MSLDKQLSSITIGNLKKNLKKENIIKEEKQLTNDSKTDDTKPKEEMNPQPKEEFGFDFDEPAGGKNDFDF